MEATCLSLHEASTISQNLTKLALKLSKNHCKLLITRQFVNSTNGLNC